MKMREARAKKLLTAEELGKQSGVSAATIHSLEQGKYLPTLTTVRKLAGVLGVIPEEVEEFKAAIDKASR
jgi:DNA-binding XRE family transcriptional regulator